MADPSVIVVNAIRPVCDGTCSLDFTESEPQQVDTLRCAVNRTLATNTGMFHVTKHIPIYGLISCINYNSNKPIISIAMPTVYIVPPFTL